MKRSTHNPAARSGAAGKTFASLCGVGGLVVLVLVAATAVSTGLAGHRGTTILVDAADENSDIGGCGEPVNPCDTIHAAVDHAEADDLIRVAAGTYSGTVTIDIPLTLEGAGAGLDPRTRDVAESIVNASNTSGFSLEANDIVINGFLIRDVTSGPALATDENFSGYQVVNNIIRDNAVGLYLNSDGASQTLVQDNVILRNNTLGLTLSGTAIYSNLGLSDALITDNYFSGHIQAAMLLAGAQSTITFSNNELDGGNTLAFSGTSAIEITDNVLDHSDANDEPAIILRGGNSDVDISGNTMKGTDVGLSIQDFGNGANSGVVVTENTFGPLATGISLADDELADTLAVHFNRFVANSDKAIQNDSSDQVDAENNWWGCNEGPNNDPDCEGIGGLSAPSVDADPWLILTLDADPNALKKGEQSDVTAMVTINSDGDDTSGVGAIPDAATVDFGPAGRVNPDEVDTVDGVATTTLTAPGSGAGNIEASATLDNETVVDPITFGNCDGLAATIVGNGVITGTTGDDVIKGKGTDVINGRGGDDLSCAHGGADTIGQRHPAWQWRE